jgi:hypothetical protein
MAANVIEIASTATHTPVRAGAGLTRSTGRDRIGIIGYGVVCGV